jgi:hypothetical protein
MLPPFLYLAGGIVTLVEIVAPFFIGARIRIWSYAEFTTVEKLVDISDAIQRACQSLQDMSSFNGWQQWSQAH